MMKNRFSAIEMGIFAVVSLVFINSVYNLFTDGRVLSGGDRKIMATAPATTGDAASNRRPADSGDGMAGFTPYETKCQSTGEVFETAAAKVRILGPFCGVPTNERQIAAEKDAPARPDAGLLDYKVENRTTHYVATVFSDQDAGKFSTDFIPLDPGANKVVMEFRYKSGKVYPVELTIVRK